MILENVAEKEDPTHHVWMKDCYWCTVGNEEGLTIALQILTQITERPE